MIEGNTFTGSFGTLSGLTTSAFVTIAWGDNSQPTSLFVGAGSGGASVPITSSHAYPEAGQYNITLSAVTSGGGSATASDIAVVADAPINPTGSPPNLSLTEGQPFSGILANFLDTSHGIGSVDAYDPGEYTTTIDWGDGTTSGGQIGIISSGGGFSVSGSHAYGEEGSYPITIIAVDDDGSTSSMRGQAVVTEQALSLSGSGAFTLTEGQSYSGALATISGASASALALDRDLSATINWGDGTSKFLGQISGTSIVQDGELRTHAYAEDGTYFVTVTLNDDDAAVASVVLTATVVEPTPILSGVGAIQLSEGDVFKGTLATVLGPNGWDPKADPDLVVSIDWGDGSVSFDKVVSHVIQANANTVHVYKEEGTYSVNVTVGGYGSSTSVTDTIIVHEVMPTLVALPATVDTLGISGYQVAQFGNIFGMVSDPDMKATITWDDGEIARCVIEGNSVFADSKNTTPGLHNYTVTVTDDGVSVSVTGTVDFVLPLTPKQIDGYVTDHLTPNSGVQGVELSLYDATTDALLQQTVSDSQGFYRIIVDKGPARSYKLVETHSEEYIDAELLDIDGSRGPVRLISMPANPVLGGDDGETVVANFALDKVPVFTSNPPTTAAIGKAYSYEISVSDPEDDPLNYSLVTAPSGMSIVSNSARQAVLNWFPTAANVGTHNVVVQVDDEWGGVVTQQFTLSVVASPPNQPPVFVSTPIVDAYVGAPYAYHAIAKDPDGDSLTYSVTSGPTGIVIANSSLGLVQWNPTVAQLGTQQVTLKVDDGHGGTATQTYSVVVHPAAGDHAPVITSTPITSVLSGQHYAYDVSAVDADQDTLTYSLTASPTGMTIDPQTGIITWNTAGVALQSYNVTVQVDDGRGLFGTQAFTVAVTALNEIRGKVSAVPAPDASRTSLLWQPLVPGKVTLSVAADGLHSATGLAYDELNNSLIASVDYDMGVPNNFDQVLSDGTVSTFSNVSGFTDEVELVAARSGNPGGFTAGDLFTSNGHPGQIVKISNNGQTVVNPWVTLPGETGLLRGDLVFDTTGLFGGNLIAVTTTGGIWEVSASGVATHFADVGNFLEGATVIPNDPNRYGPLAGKIVATAEHQSGIWAIDAAGHTTYYDLGVGTLETLNLIPAGENFYGVTEGNIVLGAPASDFSGMIGDILLVQEYADDDGGSVASNHNGVPLAASGLYRLAWDGTQLRVDPVILGAGSAQTTHWEHAIFAPLGLGPIADARPPLPGWTVFLDTNNNGQLNTGEPSTTTDSDGNYVFRNVASGSYTVAEVSQTGWTEVTPAQHVYHVTLTGGQISGGNDFVNQQNDPLGPDHSPSFSSTAITSGNVGTRYQYAASASDIDHDPLTFSLGLAPAGMAVDPNTGVVVWTPTADEVGKQQVILRVDDGRGSVTLQSFQVTVTNENYLPVFTTLAKTTVAAGLAYQYATHATDSNGDTITYSLITKPTGMTINASTGLVSWTAPTTLQTVQVVIQASDGKGGLATQAYSLIVASATEHPPVINSTPRTTLQLGRMYLYQVVASDPDGDPLTYTLDTHPTGMTINASTGLITWTPTTAQFGTNPVSLHVSDGRGSSAPQSFSIKITSQGSDRPPTISSTPPSTAIVGLPFLYDLAGSDPDGDPLLWTLTAAPQGMAIDPGSGVLSWIPVADQVGSQSVTVQVADGQGASFLQTFNVQVFGADLPPAITSTAPSLASLGTPYSYAVAANDPQGFHLTYSLTTFPTGMTIDASTGIISWPNPTPAGTQNVVVKVTDPYGTFTTQAYALLVVNNLPPVFTSTPKQAADAGQAYHYTAVATDPNGGTLTYSLVSPPSGMSINSSTGLISWTPTTTQTGTFTITVDATDPLGSIGAQTYKLTVTNDHAPTISSAVPTNTLIAGQAYVYQVVASDADGDPLTFALQNYPTWMTISSTGLISGTAPGNLATTSYSTFTVTVTDPAGMSTTQSLNLTVQADTQAPTQTTVTATPGWTVPVGTRVNFVVSANDNVAVSTLTLTVNGTPLAIDDHNAASQLFPTAGTYTVVATATDPAGNLQTYTNNLVVSAPTGPTTPIETFNSLADQSILTAPTKIMPSGSGMTSYTLSYAPLGSSTFVTIATGTTLKPDGSLGTFDPTMLPDGPYTLKLVSNNSSGQSTTVNRTINVQGKLKLGNFTLSFNDLSLPSPGLPITVTRSYDTLDAARTSDFGYGWRLDELDANLKVSLPQTGVESQGVYAGFTAGTHITLTRPGMAPEGFTFQPTVDTDFALYFGVTEQYYPNFVPDPGVTDTLSVPKIALIAYGDGTYVATSDTSLDPYNPADAIFGGNGAFTLTTVSGLAYTINAATGQYISESDRNGNTLNFSSAGIISTGPQGQVYRQVTFTRNASGQISAVTDPNGKSVTYTYSTAGDLSTVTDRMTNQTQFFYATGHPHDIDHVIDPLSRTVAQVAYGTDGRVTTIKDALGNTTTNSNNISSLSATETLPGGGGSSTVSYDNQGNPIGATDPLGNSAQATYLNGNLTSQTQVVDGVDITSIYTYDANGNTTTATDPLGNVTQVTYNTFGQPMTITDSQGNTTSYKYDGQGNLVSATSPIGVTDSYIYEASGNVISHITPNGTTTNVYDAQGNIISSTTPQGVVTTYSYDANGNWTGSQWTWIDPNNASHTQVISSTNTYDANGNLTQAIGPDGTTQTFYDGDGREYKTIDNLGGVTLTIYDSNGRVIRVTNPDGTVTDTVYDTQGRVQWTDDPHFTGKPADGTLTLYDADGRVVGTERHANVVITTNNPTTNSTSSLTSNGILLSKTTTDYDAAGRVTRTVDAANHVTNNQYDAAGHVIEVDDVVGGVARARKSAYDAAGHLTASTDALGNTTHYLYDTMGHLIKTTYPDGTTTTTSYDANGRKIASIDQDGLETDYKYDNFGNLTSVLRPAVTNPANSQTVRPTYIYGYDAYGNLTSVTDPLSHKTMYGYDALGNKVSETLPMGQSETWTFNSLNQLVSTTDFNGQKINYAYNTLGRVTQKQEYPQGSTLPTVTVTYSYNNPDTNNDGGFYDTVTTPDGTTTNFYDVNGNLVKITSPQGTINFTYDPATGSEVAVTTGNTDIRYAYDDLGRMTTVTVDKLDGISLSTSLVTRYTYDLNNDIIGTSFPNNTSEIRQYDALGRLIFLKNIGPSSAPISSDIYTLDANGNIRVEFENTGRRDDYTYDDLGRLTQEAISNDPSAGSRTLAYTYDLVGNRVASTDTGAPTGQQVLTYSYDANDRLTHVNGASGYSLAYTYDNNGNTLTVSGSQQSTYTWNLENRLVGASITTSGVTFTVSDRYDDVGNRISETTDGQTTTYLNDPNQAYDQVLEEYAANGALLSTYVRGLDMIFQDRSGVRSYYVKDGLGSTRALTNSSSVVTDTYTFDAFGDLIGQTGSTANEFLYAGYQFDKILGLDYLGSRYLSTTTGRFISMDTFASDTNSDEGFSLYAYVDDNPVNKIDPSGNIPVGLEMGKKVHKFLAVDWEKNNGVIGNTQYLANREIQTIARRIALKVARNRLRPDFVKVNANNGSGTGDIYELKHLDIAKLGILASQSAVFAGAYFLGQEALARKQLIDYYVALQTTIPTVLWGWGATWPSEFFSGSAIPVMAWPNFPSNPPGFELVTFADPVADGVMMYDFIPDKTVVEVLFAGLIAKVGFDIGLNVATALANSGNAATGARISTSFAFIPIGGGLAIGA